ncbi:MAG: pyruvate kinase alpha/beta domain-containing protein, partial [Candidatus Heimdallarchaeaceae archaeon]
MTVYFETPGDYSEQVFELVNQKLEESSIDTVIVATTRGQTALYAAENVKNARIVAVTHQAGFRNPGEMEISKEVIESLKEKGVEVLTATHALAGVDRAIRKKHGTWQISELIAETLRIFGQGTKVVA